MRRQFVASLGHLLTQCRDLASQGVDLVLLAGDDLIELVEQVFAEGSLDLQIDQALLGVWVGIHARIGLHLEAHQHRTRAR